MSSKPDTQSWHKGTYTLEYIQRNLQLPQVVKCDHSACGSEDGEEEVGCGPPLLLHSVSDLPSAIGVGVHVSVDAKGRKILTETSNTLTIPFDYEGWFVNCGSKPRDKEVRMYKDLQSLIQAGCDCFLLGGSDKVHILKKSDGDAFAPDLVHVGTMLRMLGVVQLDRKYVQCVDEANRNMLIDLRTEGAFYIITHLKKKRKMIMFRIKDIIKRRQTKLPSLIKFVYGTQALLGDTTLLKLTKIEKDVTYVGATITLGEAELVQISAKSQLKFYVADISRGWANYSGYDIAGRVCRRYGDGFRRLMKNAKVPKLSVSQYIRLSSFSNVKGGNSSLDDSTVKIPKPPQMIHLKHFVKVFEQRDRREEPENINEQSEDVKKDSSLKTRDRSRRQIPVYENIPLKTEKSPLPNLAKERIPITSEGIVYEKIAQSERHSYETLFPQMPNSTSCLLSNEPEKRVSRANSDVKYITAVHIDGRSESNVITSRKAETLDSAVNSNTCTEHVVKATNARDSVYANSPIIDEAAAESWPSGAESRSSEEDDIYEDCLRNSNQTFTLSDLRILTELNDSHDYINVDDMCVDEDDSAGSEASGSDYVNIDDRVYASIPANTGTDIAVLRRQTSNRSKRDSGVYSITGNDEGWYAFE